MGQKNRVGFSLIEVVIALGILSLGLFIVGALTQQVMNLANRAKQSSVIIDYKGLGLAMSKVDVAPWLDKMRGRAGIYDGCIPGAQGNTSHITCPAPAASLNDLAAGDTHLENLLRSDKFTQLSSGFHFLSAPIVDVGGADIAGSASAPHYLNIDGRRCEKPGSRVNCPYFAVGFFGRTNPDTASFAGFIRFVIMVGQNPHYARPEGQTYSPMATEFVRFDIGSRNDATAAECANPAAIKLGYDLSGNAYCVNPARPCVPDAGGNAQIAIGVQASGDAVCQAFPTCAGAQKVMLSPSNELICVGSSPCAANYAHIGFYSGSGGPVCLSVSTCGENKVQIGNETVTEDGSEVVRPSCVALPSPTCTATKEAIFDGTKFECKATPPSLANSCVSPSMPNGVVVGMNANGTFECRDIDPAVRGPAGDSGADGSAGTPGVPGGEGEVSEDGTDGMTPVIQGRCPAGHYMVGIENERLICEAFTPQPPPPPVVHRWYRSNIVVHKLGPIGGSCESTCAAKSKTATGRCYSLENPPPASEVFPIDHDALRNGVWDGYSYRYAGRRGTPTTEAMATPRGKCYRPGQSGGTTLTNIAEACECQ